MIADDISGGVPCGDHLRNGAEPVASMLPSRPTPPPLASTPSAAPTSVPSPPRPHRRRRRPDREYPPQAPLFHSPRSESGYEALEHLPVRRWRSGGTLPSRGSNRSIEKILVDSRSARRSNWIDHRCTGGSFFDTSPRGDHAGTRRGGVMLFEWIIDLPFYAVESISAAASRALGSFASFERLFVDESKPQSRPHHKLVTRSRTLPIELFEDK
jgi:hypothetical protein